MLDGGSLSPCSGTVRWSHSPTDTSDSVYSPPGGSITATWWHEHRIYIPVVRDLPGALRHRADINKSYPQSPDRCHYHGRRPPIPHGLCQMNTMEIIKIKLSKLSKLNSANHNQKQTDNSTPFWFHLDLFHIDWSRPNLDIYNTKRQLK